MNLISESAALRACNLPDTTYWRDWLRRNLPSNNVSTGKLYERALVDHVAAKIAPLAGTPAKLPRRTEPEIHFSGAVDSGQPSFRPKRAGEPLDNRNGPQLETR